MTTAYIICIKEESVECHVAGEKMAATFYGASLVAALVEVACCCSDEPCEMSYIDGKSAPVSTGH